jgi:leader peptidase (prepilin peptidase)/N-methyltransferase
LENYVIAIVLLIIGAALGFLLPGISEKIARYKMTKKNKFLEPDRRFPAPALKIFLCIVNALAWFIAGFWMTGLLSSALISLLFSLCLIVAVIDMRVRIIPNELVLIMVILGGVFQASHYGLEPFIFSLVCMVVMMSVFTAVAGIMGFGKVGAGDVKLAGVMGISLGYPNIIIALIIMSAILLIYIAIGLLLKKLTLQSFFPLAPFMMSGMALAFIYMILSPQVI